MGQHSRQRSFKKIAPGLVLTFTALSIASPIGALLVFPKEVDADPGAAALELTSSTPTTAPTTPPTTTHVTTTTATKTKIKTQTHTQTTTTTARPTLKPQAKPQAKPKPPAHVQAKRPTISTQTRKPLPTSTPIPVVSTRPHPTVAQRQVQRATSSTTPAPRPPPTTTTTTSKPPPILTIRSSVEKTSDPPKAPSPPSHQRLVQIAQRYVGTGIPYRMGGNSTSSGMDCSHFIWMILKEAGYPTSYRPSEALAGWSLRTSTPQPGDLVLYRGHAGIYAGNGMMIDQGKAGGAHLQKVYTQNFIGYGRIPL